jgi:hypothetical protein
MGPDGIVRARSLYTGQHRTSYSPYAPELNPPENIREDLRGNAFGHQVWETYEAIL